MVIKLLRADFSFSGTSSENTVEKVGDVKNYISIAAGKPVRLKLT
jgi:hypothetical protein